MNKTSIFIVIAAIAAIIGSPKLCAAADAGKPPELQWKCGPNARIEGNLLDRKSVV